MLISKQLARLGLVAEGDLHLPPPQPLLHIPFLLLRTWLVLRTSSTPECANLIRPVPAKYDLLCWHCCQKLVHDYLLTHQKLLSLSHDGEIPGACLHQDLRKRVAEEAISVEDRKL